MITNEILDLGHYLLGFIIGIIPSSAGFPDTAYTAFNTVGSYFDIWSPVVPIDTVFTCVSIVLSVELGVFGFKILRWIISHIPWIGGKGA